MHVKQSDLTFKISYSKICYLTDEVAERLRRWTANPLGSARVGSNPILVEFFPCYGIIWKEGEVLFNDALNTFYFTVIWRPTYGKELLR